MTNVKRQAQIDKSRWLESEKRGYDISGTMNFCSVCEFQDTVCKECTIGYLEQKYNCTCATAYNKYYRR